MKIFSQNALNINCFFVSDLHGSIGRYEKLFEKIVEELPAALFIGGDLLPSPLKKLTVSSQGSQGSQGARESREDGDVHNDFINGFLVKELKKLRERLGEFYPRVFVILGNDDGRMEEAAVLEVSSQGLWEYCHNRSVSWRDFTVYGYSYIPPSPFRLKDWERFDVSRYVDPGCTAPEEGMLSIPVPEQQLKWATIAEDLETLTAEKNLNQAIFLFHSPPYESRLDRAALDGKMIDHVPLDVHVGSIAIRRFIEERQPLLTLHGHVHESTRLTGSWRDRFNYTESFNAAHDGPELALIRFDPYCPAKAARELITV